MLEENPMRSVGACVAVVLLLACDNAVAPAGATHDASTASPTDATFSGSDSSNDAADAAAGDDAGVVGEAWGPHPPTTACVEGDSSACLRTSNQCADSRWLVTYFNGTCAAGYCQFSKEDVDCAVQTGGTCGPAPTDGGQGDAQVQFIRVASRSGSGCIVPAPPGPDAPATVCDDDAGIDAALCAPPPSVCADDEGSYWLVYYDNGQCMAGQCAWQKIRKYCSNGCWDGACASGPTAPIVAPP